ncbi:MAG: hypothetical protein [Wendovervirus sonii]|uniref:Virion structural protein n=1 Tax=phage Lak_Megaphage_Sonny TaxID=3109229 RepID=A0ABZ0Z5E5_9CAUD|nr:MAG: hypothetical protein [phage Lak_Megaphage_Sonny]
MKYLYKKIYEAINTGIQRALVLDGEEDVSIIYQHKKIDNSFNPINIFVNELLSLDIYNSDKDQIYDLYSNIIDSYNLNTDNRYKVKNFGELKKIYDAFNRVFNYKFFTYKIKNAFKSLWGWMDTSNAIMLILNDNSEISFDQFDGQDVKFIVFKSVNSKNDILIHKDYLVTDNIYQWSKRIKNNFDTSNCKIGNASQDFNGFDNTYKNINIYKKGKNNFLSYPAFQYVDNINVPGYIAYIPASGQLEFLDRNGEILTYVINCITKNKYSHIDQILQEYSDIWSSTEYTSYYAYTITGYENKSKKCHILPLFKKAES